MKKGLGKSLDEIISSGVRRPLSAAPAPASEQKGPPSASGQTLAIDQIQPNPRQPRREFNPEALEELAASIRLHGILQPITVRQGPGGGFEIIAGERRWRAARLAGLEQIPVIVKTVDDETALEMAMVENLQREDLNALEEARGYEEMATLFGLTQEEIAGKVGKDRTTIANSLRLLQLSERLHQYLVHGQLTAGHARSLLSIASEELQVRVAEQVIRDGLSVRAAEQLVKRLSAGNRPRGRGAVQQLPVATMKALEDALQQKLGTRVKILPKGQKGRIEIEYFSQDDLDRLLNLLGVNDL